MPSRRARVRHLTNTKAFNEYGRNEYEGFLVVVAATLLLLADHVAGRVAERKLSIFFCGKRADSPATLA